MPSDISILVNNVGMSKIGMLDKHSIWNALSSINVNLNSQTYMTYLLLPKLLERRSRSAIINISSYAARNPKGTKIMPVYSAAKSYNHSLSLSLHDAYKEKIDVMSVLPKACMTNIWGVKTFWTITAEAHAKAVID